MLDALKLRSKGVTVVLTGRGAPSELLDLADTVSKIKAIKHAFDAGVPAQRGIEH